MNEFEIPSLWILERVTNFYLKNNIADSEQLLLKLQRQIESLHCILLDFLENYQVEKLISLV